MHISRKAFQSINTDQNQTINKAELQAFVQKHDTDGDGKLSETEGQKAGLNAQDLEQVNQGLNRSASMGANEVLFNAGPAGRAEPITPLTPPPGPMRQVRQTQVDALNTKVSHNISDMFKNAPKGSNVHKLGTALSMMQMLNSDQLGDDKNKNLEQYDAEARGILGMRRSQVEDMVQELMQKPDVKAAFAKARNKGMEQVFGQNHQEVGKEYANYILSDGFYQELSGLSEQAKGERLKSEIQRLTVLDPQLAQQTAADFAAKELQQQPEKFLQQFSKDQLEDAVGKMLQLEAQSSAAQEAVSAAKTGGSVLGKGMDVKGLLNNEQTRRKIASALSEAMSHKSFYAAMGDDAKSTALIQRLNNMGTEDAKYAAQVVERMKTGGSFGRGLSSFMSGVALAGIVTNFPPVDKEGNIQWGSVAGMTSSGLGITGSAPTIAKFIKEDLGLMKSASSAAKAGDLAGDIANAGKFAKVAKWLGPVGDAISLPFSISGAVNEHANEDSVGTWTNGVSAGASVLGIAGGVAAAAGSTGIGIPVAVVAGVIGLGAAGIDYFFGESALTGQVRQDLRYLGISGAEEQTYKNMTTEKVTKTGFFGGTYTDTEHLSHAQIRERAKSATPEQKVQLINQYMDQNTSGSEETLIYNILYDTPYEGQKFLDLIENIDTQQLASELESDSQAGKVLDWITKAYQKAGKPPGKALTDFMRQLAKDHRDEIINDYLKNTDKAFYQKIDPSAIRDMTNFLMAGDTNSGEEKAIYELLNKTSYAQFNKLIEDGKFGYIQDLKSELSTSQFRNVRKWMQDADAGASITLQSYARSIGS